MIRKGDIMRILGIVLCSILLAASTALAGFNLKSSVYRMDELDAAESAALSGRKPIAFLYSDQKTFCTLCIGASRQVMETLADSCIMVYVSTSDAAKLPLQVQNALRSPEAGRYIPVVVVMSYNLKKVIAIVPYAKGEAYKKLLSEAKKKIASNR